MQRHFLGRHHATVCHHADLTGQHHAVLVLVCTEEIAVFPQLCHLLRVDKDDLVRVHFLVQHVNGVHNAGVLDRRRTAVIGQLCPLQCSHGIGIDLRRDGLSDLVIGLCHWVAIAGQHGFVCQFHRFHRFLDLHGGGAGLELYGVCLYALGNVYRIADVAVLRHSDRVTRYALQGGVHLCERSDNDLAGDFGGDHIRHDLRIYKVLNGCCFCHSYSPFLPVRVSYVSLSVLYKSSR